jgi:hypothetical protein
MYMHFHRISPAYTQAIIVKRIRIGIEIAGKFFGSRCLEL